jgi:hypothetical protein
MTPYRRLKTKGRGLQGAGLNDLFYGDIDAQDWVAGIVDTWVIPRQVF